jgi:hypothetical protein
LPQVLGFENFHSDDVYKFKAMVLPELVRGRNLTVEQKQGLQQWVAAGTPRATLCHDKSNRDDFGLGGSLILTGNLNSQAASFLDTYFNRSYALTSDIATTGSARTIEGAKAFPDAEHELPLLDTVWTLHGPSVPKAEQLYIANDEDVSVTRFAFGSGCGIHSARSCSVRSVPQAVTHRSALVPVAARRPQGT